MSGGGRRGRGVPRPDPGSGPWAELACEVHDELYDPADRPSVAAIAKRTGISAGHVHKILSGTGRSRWDPMGHALVQFLGGDPGVWASRWAAAEERQQTAEANDGVEPLPWVDDEETPPAVPELAVRDWDDRPGLSRRVRRWWRWTACLVAAAAPIAAVITGRYWLLAVTVIIAPVAGAAIARRVRRRADPQRWRRQIILGPVSDRVTDLLREYERAPIQQRLVRLSLPLSGSGSRRKQGAAGAVDVAEQMPYPEGTTVLAAFEEGGQTLVLISEAGMGKTTQLALLAQHLIARARAVPGAERAALPFLVDLSSYRGEPFDDWLVAAINREYRLHPTLVRGLVAGTVPGDAGDNSMDAILLLLDGLDEIPERRHRQACTDHLREFRQRCAGLVVTCRNRDLALAGQIEATRYVLIERPSRAVVQQYLAAHAAALADVRAALESDQSLWDLLQSPLWLQLISRTYANRPATGVRRPGSTDQERRDREQLILDAYVRRMLDHRHSRYPREKTLTWLTWLARALGQRAGQTLHLDRLDHTWITSTDGPAGRPVSPIPAALLAGALLGGAALAAGAALGLVENLATAAAGLLFVAVFVALKASAGADLYGLRPVEQLRWSWKPEALLRRAGDDPAAAGRLGVEMSWGDGAVAVAVLGPLFPGGFTVPVFLSLTPMIVIWLAVHTVTDTNFVPALRDERNLPNEGIRRSLRHALVAGAVLAVPLSAYFAVSMSLLGVPLANLIYLGTVLALAYGLGRAFQLGGSACACYWAVRVRLRRLGHAPLRYQRFLHDAEQRILLRRVGSGFAFPHRRLLEHLDTQPDDLLRRLAAQQP